MKLATTTEDFGRILNFDYEACIRNTVQAGFRCVDLSMYIVRPSDPLFYGPEWRSLAEQLRALGDELDFSYVQAHSPSGNPFRSNEDYESYTAKTIRAIQVCGILGIPNLVVHGGFFPGLEQKEYFQKNGRFFQQLFPYMEQCNVNVLCENGRQEKDFFVLHSGELMREFIDYVDHPLFHCCWDTGHANINGPQYEDLLVLDEELYALHVNDNRGSSDEHMIPYFGTVNMDEIMHALLKIGYSGYFTFEATYSLRPADLHLGARRRFEQDTRLLHPTLEMQQDITRFMYQMGTHILKVYDCFEG